MYSLLAHLVFFFAVADEAIWTRLADIIFDVAGSRCANYLALAFHSDTAHFPSVTEAEGVVHAGLSESNFLMLSVVFRGCTPLAASKFSGGAPRVSVILSKQWGKDGEGTRESAQVQVGCNA